LVPLPEIHPDDGDYTIGLEGPAFPTRAFAESVRLASTRHQIRWVPQ
jgi:hypothetical protein